MTTTTASLSASEAGPARDCETFGIRWVFPDVATSFRALPRDRGVIGRQADCALAVTGSEVSRAHAEIWKENGVYWVRDLGSRNGTSVNGRRRDGAQLALGDVIRVGNWIGVFTVSACGSLQDDSMQDAFQEIAGGLILGPALRSRLAPVLQVARSTLPVLILGETGVGKEVVARAVHALSGRAGAYRTINCAALPESLAESELFGYKKGAFTGAAAPHAGHIRAAEGGTLFLDEVAELPLPVQAKLLRTLENHEVQPLGGSSPSTVDARIVAATASDLRVAVTERRFRDDLLARLNGVTITLPPLRERREEIVYLFRSLMSSRIGCTAGMSAGFAEALCLHDWTQNVRELAFTAQRVASLYGTEPLLRRRHLREVFGLSIAGETSSTAASESVGVNAVVLVEAIRAHGGNLARAASALNMSRGRAYRLLREAGLESFRDDGRRD